MKTTMKQIAEACGVSVSLVSRIINGDKSLKCKPETREKVLKQIEESRFVPDYHAQRLANHSIKQNKDIRIGYISYKGVDRMPNPYFDKIIEGITTILAEEEYTVKRFYIDEVASLYRKKIPLADKPFDGLILFGNVPDDLVEYLRQQTKYLSSVYGDEIPDADFVGSDIVSTINIVVDYIKRMGYSEIGLALGSDEMRTKALLEYAAKNGISIDENFTFEGMNNFGTAYRIMSEKLKSNKPPKLICCMNDEMALGVINALLDSGYSVPNDVSVTGHDDIARSSYGKVPLTTVRIYKEEIGRLVSDLLLERINYKRKFPVKVFVPCDLVVRKSVKRFNREGK